MTDQFPVVMRGYDRAQVDERISQLEASLEQTRDHVSRLDAQILQLSAELTEAHERLRDNPDAWRRLVERWDFTDVNDLIDRHNRWFPTEARLRMDPRTRDYVKIGGRPYQREFLDAAWIRERIP